MGTTKRLLAFGIGIFVLSAVACISPVDSVIPPDEDDTEAPQGEDEDGEAFHFLLSDEMSMFS